MQKTCKQTPGQPTKGVKAVNGKHPIKGYERGGKVVAPYLRFPKKAARGK